MAEIYIIDDQNPEDNAMMQALYSRSPKSVTEHKKKVEKVGSGEFMGQYYVGYNHKSIGDCGSTTAYIENVSMLAAKAVQDTPLYSGQEASTRYINMLERPVLNPLGTKAGQDIQNRWMDFYKRATSLVVDHLKDQYPRLENEDVTQYQKAIKARSFDILRGFLPAGCTTYVSWHTNLRQAADHLDELRYYPLREVRNLAQDIQAQLEFKYPHSFVSKTTPEVEKYLELCGKHHLYDTTTAPPEGAVEMHTTNGTLMQLSELSVLSDPAIVNRPKHYRLPHRYDDLGTFTFKHLLDFGSFRDLQRHRNGVCRMPLLSTKWGFHSWYLSQLPEKLCEEAQELLHTQTAAINELAADPEEAQYYTAMGFNVVCRTTRGLPGTLYVIELRTSPTVHPTLRSIMQAEAKILRRLLPTITMYDDQSPDSWSIRRGTQDIVEK